VAPDGDDLAFACLSEPAPAGSFGRFGPLKLGDLINDAVSEFTFRAIICPVV
jgi:hypothetical protein